MDGRALFHDREEAGHRLAEALEGRELFAHEVLPVVPRR